MIKLVTRKEVVAGRRIIMSELAKMQKAFHDEDVLQLYKDDNEESLYWESFDFFDHEITVYDQFNKIAGFDHADISTFTKTLTSRLVSLLKHIEAKEFIILSHVRRNFFGNRDNDFLPLVEAYKILEQITGSSSYDEAFILTEESLPDFMAVLFWIARCDPSAPEFIFVFDKDEKIQFNICKYGNLHFTEFGSERLTKNELELLGWDFIEGEEYDRFSEDGKIQGRISEIK